MPDCGNCSGCSGCTGCGGALELAPEELRVLRELGEIPFLPIARRADAETPVCLEFPDLNPEESGLILLCLEKRGLISVDYDQPLGGFVYNGYEALPVRGSIALTARGQQVVEVLDVMGLQ